MKKYSHSFSPLVSVPVLALTLICSFAHAQGLSPSGSYGFLINVSLDPMTNDSGTAILGLMNFDSAGNVTGTLNFARGAHKGRAPETTIATLTGTYSGNPDGTGSLTVTLASTLTFTFATVLTDGGKGLQLVATKLIGGNIGGGVVGGIARAAYTGPVRGSYGFQLQDSPHPVGNIGVATLDGAGNVTASFTAVGAGSDPNQPPMVSGTVTGTYLLPRWERRDQFPGHWNLRLCCHRRGFRDSLPADRRALRR
jgi:hypothetical protein